MGLRPGQAKGPSLSSGGGGGGGAISFGANVGTGTGSSFKNVVTDTMNFRTLLEGAGITITTGTNEVTIGLDQAGTTDRIVKWLNGTGTLADSLMLEQTDGILLSTAVASPGAISFKLCDEGTEQISFIKEATTQDLVVELNTFGEMLRLTQTGIFSVSSNSPDLTSKMFVSNEGTVITAFQNSATFDQRGNYAAILRFKGTELDYSTPITYGEIGCEIINQSDDTASFGALCFYPRLGGALYETLSLTHRNFSDSLMEIKNKAGIPFGSFDAGTQSLTVGSQSTITGILNLISDTLIPESQQINFNVGDETADSGTFTRIGKVRKICDVGTLTDDASKLLVEIGYIGYGHVWASDADGYDGAVNQASFSFDSTSISIWNAVGAIAADDTDGNLCIWVDSSNNLVVKNRLGTTRTFGYDVTFYDNPLVPNWNQVGPVKQWRSNYSTEYGEIQVAVPNNDYIYVSSDFGATWAAKGLVKPWYGVCCSGENFNVFMYAIEGRDAGGGYVYKSADAGLSWTKISALSTSRRWQHITCDYTGQHVVICVTNGYIYYSVDYGVTWAQSNAPSKNWASVILSGDGLVGYAVADTGYIYKTTDSGATWTAVKTDETPRWDCIECTYNGVKIIAAAAPGFIYTSDDSGATWVKNTTMGSAEWHEVSMDDTASNACILTHDDALWSSTDAGLTWTKDDTLPTGVTWWCCYQSNMNEYKMVVGNNTKIFRLYTP
jgi:photosystem II stability/assembly factor-like uncharacterized protein